MRGCAALTLIAVTLISGLTPKEAGAEDWPTAAHDAARSGRTADVAPGPYRVRWAKAWQYENIATTSQLIVAEGRGFIGTLGRDGSLAGKVHCVDVRDGRELWTFESMQGGIAHTLTWSPANEGTVYAATTYGEVFALNAETGELRWKFETPLGGFVVNPCVANNAVLLGSRQGVFYALEEADGAVRWQRDVKLPICHTAAAADGVVYFLDEGINAFAINIADGKLAPGWIVRQLHGGSARFYWPVITKDHVLMTVAPPHQYNWAETDAVLFKVPGVKDRKGGDRYAIGTPEQEQQEQANVIECLKRDPHSQVLHCLARANGRPSCTPGVLHTGGSNSELTPPVLTKEDQIVCEYRSWYSLWDSDSWVNPYSALGTLDPTTGVVTQIRPQLEGKRVPWGHIWIIADESSAFSVAGDTLLVAHQGNYGGTDFANNNKTFAGIGKRDTWGGYPPLSWSRQEWHGGPRSPLTIVDGTVYYVVGGRVIACEGNATKGEKNAEPEVVPAKRVVKLREFVEESNYPSIAEIDQVLTSKRSEPEVDREETLAMRTALDLHIKELLASAPHGELHEWRGISPSGTSFKPRDQMAHALGVAVPHLPKDTSASALAYIETIMGRRADDPNVTLNRAESRNYHIVDQRDYRSGAAYIFGPDARYDYATMNRINDAKRSKVEEGNFFGDVLHVRFPDWTTHRVGDILTPNEGLLTFEKIEAYSRQLTHLAGQARSLARKQRQRELEAVELRFLSVFKPFLDHYRNVGRSCAKHIDAIPGDEKHPSAGGQFRNLGGPYVGDMHMAAIVYWTDLCPEVGELLREFAPEETEAIRAWMLRNAQGFYLARWDTPVQEGEVACPWYVTTQNYFHFFSTIDQADAVTHRLLVDRPVCYADVYYIERLVRAIEVGKLP